MSSRINNSGLTLVELVVALALSSLMLAASSGILAAVHRQNRRLKIDRFVDVQHSFRAALWQDASQASGAAVQSGMFILEEMSSTIDPKFGSHVVAYHLVQDKEPRLVRELYRHRGRQLDLVSSQVLLWHVHSAVFERLDSSGSAHPFPQSLGPSPSGILYTLEMENDQAAIQGEITIR